MTDLVPRTVPPVEHDPSRKLLPDRRRSCVFKEPVRGKAVFVTIGYYEDGSPAEVFIDCMRTGSAMRQLLSAFAQVVSVALQCGTPVSELQRSLRGLQEATEQGFDPSLVIAFMFECLLVPYEAPMQTGPEPEFESEEEA